MQASKIFRTSLSYQYLNLIASVSSAYMQVINLKKYL